MKTVAFVLWVGVIGLLATAYAQEKSSAPTSMSAEKAPELTGDQKRELRDLIDEVYKEQLRLENSQLRLALKIQALHRDGWDLDPTTGTYKKSEKK